MRCSILALSVLILCAGCCHPDRLAPDIVPSAEPWKPTLAWYAARAPDSTACIPEALVGQLVASTMDTDAAWHQCLVRLHEAQGVAGIDLSVAAGRLQAAQEEADRMAAARWTWGGIGVALGAIVAGLVVGLAH